jgi:hypothetical protein
MAKKTTSLSFIREAIAGFAPSAQVDPNDEIDRSRAFFPNGHRAILDFQRQLVVGNRGMGKSFWTHALLNADVRGRLADVYDQPALNTLSVIVGFNGSIKKTDGLTPTIEEIKVLRENNHSEEIIWKGVLFRIALHIQGRSYKSIERTIEHLSADRLAYTHLLSEADDFLKNKKANLLVVFDALDRLAESWVEIRSLSRSLLVLALGLNSFRSIRAKIFMRSDQYEDAETFRFPDSSKLKNSSVNLTWRPFDLYGLLLFEIMRDQDASRQLRDLAKKSGLTTALPEEGEIGHTDIEEQRRIIQAIAGEYMGSDKKRGHVYTWVPLHLSDAKEACSPRTFLTAWKTAAEVPPPPSTLAVDYKGLLEGVREASSTRLKELFEDYPWLDLTLNALNGLFVPISKEELRKAWKKGGISAEIATKMGGRSQPIGFSPKVDDDFSILLEVMKSVAVLEERVNGKINVPDIFRVGAGIKRKGGVAVPRKN